MPGEIEKLETALESVQSLVAAADFYSQDNDYVTETLAQVEEVRASLDATEERWLELEAMLDEG